MPPQRLERLALPALILLSLAARLLWLRQGALAHDEPFTVYWSQQPWADFRAMLRTENNPPLHFLITRWWSALVPFEPAWLRVPSALFSGLIAWPVFLIGRRIGGMRAAITAALLIILSNYHQGFAQEVRGYALLTLLSAWSIWLVVRMADGRARAIGLLALVNTAMVYTHFFGWLVVGLQVTAAFALPALRKRKQDVLVSAGLTLFAFGPYLLLFALRARASISEGTWLEAPAWEELYNMVWRWSNSPVMAVAFMTLIAFVLLRKHGRSAWHALPLLWSIAPLLGLFAISFVVPVFLDRYLAFAAPGFALLIAASIESLRLGQRWKSALACLAIAGMAFTFNPGAGGRYAPEGVARQVDAWCANDCHVEVVPSWYWLNYLAAKDIEALRSDQRSLLNASPFVPDTVQARALGPTLLVDASGNQRFAPLREALRGAYGAVDSVEADHRVWVYRFTHEGRTARP